MSAFFKFLGAASLFIVSACGGVQENTPAVEDTPAAPDIAAATSALPVSHILLGEFAENETDGVSIINIEPLLAAPTYQSQPMFLGPDQARFYYVAGNDNGKTDLWVYDLASGDRSNLTNSPEKSEFSPKPAPGGRLSYIQESEDGAMTRVHLLRSNGDAGDAVVEAGPVGYFEWLREGSEVAVFFRNEPPMLQLVDVASGEARDVFENVGRVLQASPDGSALFATRADENGEYEIVVVDAVSGATESLLSLPTGAQDFFLTFDEYGNPSIAFSSMGAQLMTFSFATDSVWHVAGDISALGYDSISRIAVASGSLSSEVGESRAGLGPVVFVVHSADE